MENLNNCILASEQIQAIAPHEFDMGSEVIPIMDHEDEGDAPLPMPNQNTPVMIVGRAPVTLDDITFNTEETEDPGQIGVLNTDWVIISDKKGHVIFSSFSLAARE